MNGRRWLPLLGVLGMGLAALAAPPEGTGAHAAAPAPMPAVPRLAFLGLHGGIFDKLNIHARTFDLRMDHVTIDALAAGQVDLANFQLLFCQYVDPKNQDMLRKAILAARARTPALCVRFLATGYADMVPELKAAVGIQDDPALCRYYDQPNAENLRRLLGYVNVAYLGRQGTVEPPAEVPHSGLYHPDHDGLFPTTEDFLAWVREHRREQIAAPRAIVDVHFPQLTMQQPEVVKTILRALERRGILAVAAIDYDPMYETNVLAFAPDCVVHTCCTPESLEFRRQLDVPHLHSVYFRQQSIDEWHKSPEGLLPGDYFFQIASGEFIGSIEPHVGGGPLHPGGSAEASTPVSNRIERLADRTAAWIHLRRQPNAAKKVAFIYYDQGLGKAELMRGTATGMFMNGPRSLVSVLQRMQAAGYGISPTPRTEDELMSWLLEHGRQIGIWAPGVLDRLARSGDAVLIPASTYATWFETRVPEAQRREVIQRWGQPPGKFLVWERDGEPFIVIPRIDLGNIILLPQPLRGEAHDAIALIHDRLVPPPHNYLATYFWLQEQFGADAVVHFGTHGSEILMATKAVGMCDADWTDILLGNMPNINPWIINNLGEGPLARRRAYAVLIDHLTPPSVKAGLSDGLLNLSNEIAKWKSLENGSLREQFVTYITSSVRDEKLDADLHLDLADGRLLTAEEIERVAEHLHRLHNETIPVGLHTFGQPPPDDLLVPYIVNCLRKRFLDAFATVLDTASTAGTSSGAREMEVRRRAEEAVDLVLRHQMAPADAVAAVGGTVGPDGLSTILRDGFALAIQLRDGFAKTTQEIDNLLAALDGRFIPPGPGNSPDRNAGSVPTGRNMYLMNPEEVPSPSSWELGKKLADELIAQRLAAQGHFPEKIGFWLSPFSSFHDYGVMESEILYLLGVRPVWDNRNVVSDVQLISSAELGRPRLDVFIATEGVYNDLLPSRLQLIDKAIRLVAALEEDDNPVRTHAERVRIELEESGLAPERSATLSRARIFGYPPGERAQWAYWYYVLRSGEWEGRDNLVDAYLENVKYVYTEGAWGENAPEAYDRHIRGTEVVVKSWSDTTGSPISGSYFWFDSGSFSLAIKHLTGHEPDLIFSDVHDPDRSRMVAVQDALRENYRTRLFNRKWIEGMMQEGYAGADLIAKHVANTLGWKIMREDDIADDIWEEIVDIYVRDSRNLQIREWFDVQNPYAFQEVAEVLLESVRKGYWNPDAATVLEIATAYARSVAAHGEDGGIRGSGNNPQLEAFIKQTLATAHSPEIETLIKACDAESRKLKEAAPAPAPPTVAAAPADGATRVAADPGSIPPAPPPAQSQGVTGEQLAEVPAEHHRTDARWLGAAAILAALLLIGFMGRRGGIR